MDSKTVSIKKEKIESSELDYYQSLQTDISAVQGAFQSFAQHLSVKYKLQGNDQITPDGDIVRKGADDG